MAEIFDPLSGATQEALASAIKQRVRNIIRSYNHPSDLLSEPIQNAVDEVDEAVHVKAIEQGNIEVVIDCSTGKVSVSDNGRGIEQDAMRRLLAPDVTHKAQLFQVGRSRGHKGVGLTFLAYGFNHFEIESRTADEHYIVRIENARQWVERAEIVEVPKATLNHLAEDEGTLRSTGTRVTIQVSDQTEPRSLYRAFLNPDYAQTVLETQTALGVYPKSAGNKEPHFDAHLKYITRDGALTLKKLSATYRFPHLSLKKGAKTFDVGEYLAGDHDTTPPAKWRKKHESVYRFYSTEQLVSMVKGKAGGDLLGDDAEVDALFRRHGVTAYALAGYSSAYKATLSESWHVPVKRKAIAPSIRVATDSMISSWQRDLSLSHRGFNVERIWLFVHFVNVEPDLGRKDYPPAILEALNLLEDPLADDIAKQATPFLIATTSSGKPIDYTKPERKALDRMKKPFPVKLPDEAPQISYLTEPEEEQDVVALFNELRGLGVLRHFVPVFFSSAYVYDSYFEYEPENVPELLSSKFTSTPPVERLRSGIAEFKFSASHLVHDLVRELKTWGEITWLVCWEAQAGQKKEGGLTLDIEKISPEDSPYAGVTHLGTLSSAGEKNVYIISLKHLLQELATN